MTDDFLVKNLREFMELRRFNAKQLSRKAGLGETAVRDIIKGYTRSPKVSTIQAIARALNVTVETLYAEGGSSQGAATLSATNLPIIDAPVVELNQLKKLSDGEAAVWRDALPIVYDKTTVAAVVMPDNTLNRVIPKDSYCIVDYADTDLVDDKIYVLELGGMIGIRRYRNTGGPERFESDSTERVDTLYCMEGNPITVLGRVVMMAREL